MSPPGDAELTDLTSDVEGSINREKETCRRRALRVVTGIKKVVFPLVHIKLNRESVVGSQSQSPAVDKGSQFISVGSMGLRFNRTTTIC